MIFSLDVKQCCGHDVVYLCASSVVYSVLGCGENEMNKEIIIELKKSSSNM